MNNRAKFFDDISGLAGGAFSALTGLREEVKALVQSRVEELLSALELVRREEFDAMVQMASHCRAETEHLTHQVNELQTRLERLEKRPAASSDKKAS